MRIGIDVQTLETNERTRGIGRICTDTIAALAAYAPEHNYCLFGLSPHPPEPVLPHLGQNMRYIQIRLDGDSREHLRLGCAAPFLWTTPEGRLLDVYHVTSPLMFDILLPTPGPCAIAATLLDAIPAIMHERGTPLYDAAGWQRYQARVNLLAAWQRYLPISRSAAKDCARALELRADCMDVTYVPIRQRPSAHISDAMTAATLRKFKLEPGFVVSVTGYNPRKNIPGTLRSYALIPNKLRQTHPLVLICSLLPEEREDIHVQAHKLGIDHHVRLTGYVGDDEVVSLVMSAYVMLFPSRYEGFGIPVSEAMACGTPVVSSNASSLPEVVGEAGFMCDPDDEAGFAAAMGALLYGAELRREYTTAGYRKVEEFSTENYIKRLIGAYENTARGRVINIRTESAVAAGANNRIRIANFSPLSPCMSGIAEYNEQLLLHLDDDIEVDCFIEDYTPDNPGIRQRCNCYHYSRFNQMQERHPYDAFLYQIGNNILHAYMLPYAERHPGVVVLHDASLQGLKRYLARQRGERHAIQLAFQHEYPDADASVWENDQALNNLSLVDYKMNSICLSRSRAAVVHSRWLRDELQGGRGEELPVEVIPMGINADLDGWEPPPREELRRHYQLPPDAFVIVSVGIINPFKRLMKVLEAFDDFHRVYPNSYFVLLGPADRFVLKEMNDYNRAAGLKHCVRFLGHRPNQQMYEVISLADVCVNLRYPTLGESSATLACVMALGKPVLVTPINQFREFPNNVCWKVDYGPLERRELMAYFRCLREYPEVAEQLGRNTREYVRNHNWKVLAKRYAEILRNAALAQRNDPAPTVMMGED